MNAASPHLKPILLLAYHTGMRKGEILNLKWEQVDLEDGWINLKPEQTKTHEARRIPLHPNVIENLKKITQEEEHVFLYKGKPIKEIKKGFKNALKRAGIKDFRFHDLRHTFVTNMRKAGKQDRSIMKITGHKTMSVFLRYDTVDDEDLKKVVAC